jgi:hypothetical protein
MSQATINKVSLLGPVAGEPASCSITTFQKPNWHSLHPFKAYSAVRWLHFSLVFAILSRNISISRPIVLPSHTKHVEMAESNENSTLRKENDAPSTRLTDTETLLYRYGFWDKEMRPHRQSLLGVLFVPLFLTTLLMWVCLSIYWGSLVPSSSSKPLTVTVTNLDVGGEFGAGVVAAIQIASQAKGNTIKWLFDSNIESVNDSRGLIVEEKTWGAVLSMSPLLLKPRSLNFSLVTPNTTADLENALRLGTNTYDPQNSILFLYASARNQITVNSHIVPPVLAIMTPIIGQRAVQHTETFLQSIVNNTEALQTALKCPQCLASPFGITSLDIVPFDVPEATGSTMVGLIFVGLFLLLSILETNIGEAPHLHIFHIPDPTSHRPDNWRTPSTILSPNLSHDLIPICISHHGSIIHTCESCFWCANEQTLWSWRVCGLLAVKHMHYGRRYVAVIGCAIGILTGFSWLADGIAFHDHWVEVGRVLPQLL